MIAGKIYFVWNLAEPLDFLESLEKVLAYLVQLAKDFVGNLVDYLVGILVEHLVGILLQLAKDFVGNLVDLEKVLVYLIYDL